MPVRFAVEGSMYGRDCKRIWDVYVVYAASNGIYDNFSEADSCRRDSLSGSDCVSEWSCRIGGV